MSYAHILALIDQDLELLRKARAVLMAPASPIRATPRHSLDQPLPAAPPAVHDSQLAPPVPVEQPESPVPVTRVKSRMPRQARRVSKPAPVVTSSALDSSVPRGPVFVSPERVRQEQAQREQLAFANAGLADPAVAEQLTAELLSSRWLRSSA